MSPAEGIFKPISIISDNDPEIVKLIPPSVVAAHLVKALAKGKSSLDMLTARDADHAIAYWLYVTPPVPPPRPFAWPGESGLAYARLPWKAEAGEIPTWERILGRMSNRHAFMAWIGSLFDEKSYEQQYVWIHGKGLEGKGAINRFLRSVFGPAYCTKQPPNRWGDKFWTHELLGKRLVVFPDCDDTSFVATGLFKSLTGGDPVTVEGKGEMAYTTKLNAKYMLFSNERPSLSSDVADRRRIIYCEIEPRSKDDPVDVDFEGKMWIEGGAFLGKCIEAYSPTAGQAIKTDDESIGEWIETVEMNFAETFDFYFIETDDKAKWLTGEQLQRTIRWKLKSRKEQIAFISWLERVKGIKRQTVDKGGSVKKYKRLCHKPGRIYDDKDPVDGRQIPYDGDR